MTPVPPAVSRWATWPMPNSVGQGLPNELSYELPGGSAGATAEVVHDRVTGLTWQRAAGPQSVSFDAARAACEQLTLQGRDDWRLPTRVELVSLLNLVRTAPAIDLVAFEGAPSNWYWTSTAFAGDPSKGWYVYFYFGYPDVEDTSSTFAARCVRAEAAADAGGTAPRYELRPETVRDVKTALTWQRAVSPGTFTYAGAADHCRTLAAAGLNGWRVPTMKELQTLIDDSRVNPAIDLAAFPETPNEAFWSSSPWSDTPSLAWYVRFDQGGALYDLATAERRVRCVR